MRQLQADKSLLEAKLKEALAAQPAAVDPRELARAEEKIRGLQKENDLLKVSLAQEKAKPAPAPDTKALDEARQALAEANRKLAEQTKAANALAARKDRPPDQAEQPCRQPRQRRRPRSDARRRWQDANRKLAEQTKARLRRWRWRRRPSGPR